MSVALERSLVFGLAIPESGKTGAEATLGVAVVFTSVQATKAALKTAATLARKLRAHITLLVPQIVPHPLPLAKPAVLIDFTERRLRVMAETSPIETSVRIYLCRDRAETLLRVLKPHSLVVLGGPNTWWPTPEKRLARRLRRAGHHVVEAETE